MAPASPSEPTPWSLKLCLVSYGSGERMLPAVPVGLTRLGNRVHYGRGTLTEWYVNDPSGLEQGFTLAEPPGGTATAEHPPREEEQPLAFTFALDSGPAPVLGTDAQGRPLGAWLSLQESGFTIHVDDQGATYPITVDPTFTQQQKLTASDKAAGRLLRLFRGGERRHRRGGSALRRPRRDERRGGCLCLHRWADQQSIGYRHPGRFHHRIPGSRGTYTHSYAYTHTYSCAYSYTYTHSYAYPHTYSYTRPTSTSGATSASSLAYWRHNSCSSPSNSRHLPLKETALAVLY